MVYDSIIDSDATQDMTFEREWFTTYESIVPCILNSYLDYETENIIVF
jgi:hypothetical protein